MRAEGGAAGFARIAAELIRATFGGEAAGRRGRAKTLRRESRSPGTS